jgi:hypothetical protein
MNKEPIFEPPHEKGTAFVAFFHLQLYLSCKGVQSLLVRRTLRDGKAPWRPSLFSPNLHIVHFFSCIDYKACAHL